MKVDDDPNVRLSDETIARRGAELARVCEDTYQEVLKTNPDAVRPVYIVGSEVPFGGAQEADAGMQVTRVEDFKATVETIEAGIQKRRIGRYLEGCHRRGCSTRCRRKRCRMYGI